MILHAQLFFRQNKFKQSRLIILLLRLFKNWFSKIRPLINHRQPRNGAVKRSLLAEQTLQVLSS